MVHALGIGLLASVCYALLDGTTHNAAFLAQVLVLPAQVMLGLIAHVVPLRLGCGWLDVDVTTTAARSGRAIAFGLTALAVYLPAQGYRSRRTPFTLVLAIAPWVVIAFTMMLFLVLLIGMEQSWSN